MPAWVGPVACSALALTTCAAFVGCASTVRALGPNIAPSALFRAQCREPLVALTIDDGPVPGSTERLLEVLRETGSHATFFLVGERAEAHETLIDAIVGAGHEVGNHTWQETPTMRMSDEDARESILDTHALLTTHAPVRWLRPGSARYDDDILALAEELGYGIALGDTWPYDTFITWTRFHAWYVRNGVRPGSIIVLHNAHGRGKRAAQTLARVIPLLHEDGYQVLSLTQLVDHPACQPPQAATVVGDDH